MTEVRRRRRRDVNGQIERAHAFSSFTVCGGGVPAGAPSAIAATRDTQRKDTWVVAGEVRQGQGTWGGRGVERKQKGKCHSLTIIN